MEFRKGGRTVQWLADKIAALPHDAKGSMGERLPPSAITVWADSVSRMDPDMFGRKATFGAGGLAAAEQLARISCPLHLAHGDVDMGSFVTEAEINWLLAGHSGATVTRYPQTGHTIHAWRPLEFAQDLKAFLARVA